MSTDPGIAYTFLGLSNVEELPIVKIFLLALAVVEAELLVSLLDVSDDDVVNAADLLSVSLTALGRLPVDILMPRGRLPVSLFL